jgi:hypothetical protein
MVKVSLHMHQVNLAIYGNGVYHMAIKVYNGLPYELKTNFSYPKKFKANLKDFFIIIHFIHWKNFLTDGFHFLNILLFNV